VIALIFLADLPLKKSWLALANQDFFRGKAAKIAMQERFS
jgi:hypothetical protein